MHETAFPKVLKSLHQLSFDYGDGDGIDFEPFQQFLTPEESDEWLRAWTGNDLVAAEQFKVFGEDGTGGFAAFWLVGQEGSLLEQPIVFFGSEGELGVVASNFNAYLWLLAAGIGPYEAVSYGAELALGSEEFRTFALENAVDDERLPSEILNEAKLRYPDFEETIREMCN